MEVRTGELDIAQGRHPETVQVDVFSRYGKLADSGVAGFIGLDDAEFHERPSTHGRAVAATGTSGGLEQLITGKLLITQCAEVAFQPQIKPRVGGHQRAFEFRNGGGDKLDAETVLTKYCLGRFPILGNAVDHINGQGVAGGHLAGVGDGPACALRSSAQPSQNCARL